MGWIKDNVRQFKETELPVTDRNGKTVWTADGKKARAIVKDARAAKKK